MPFSLRPLAHERLFFLFMPSVHRQGLRIWGCALNCYDWAQRQETSHFVTASRVSVIQGKFWPWQLMLTYNGTCTRCGICKFNWYDSNAGFKAFEHVVFIAANYSWSFKIHRHKISNVGPRFLRPISHRHQQSIVCKIFMLLSIFLKLILDNKFFRHTKLSNISMTTMNGVC